MMPTVSLIHLLDQPAPEEAGPLHVKVTACSATPHSQYLNATHSYLRL
jgi:hypothetical protein